MKIQLITAIAALWSCREKRPDRFGSSRQRRRDRRHPRVDAETVGPVPTGRMVTTKVGDETSCLHLMNQQVAAPA
ncbi:MAG: hypothetical protein ACI92S_004407 [Planctomycetaceae bacterium]|jgi:hypothetical protein